MTDRPIRDIVAEALRWTKLGFRLPSWRECDELYKANWLDDAGKLMRVLEHHGVRLVRDGEPSNPVEKINTTFWRHELGEGMAVFMRADGENKFSVVYEKDGKQNAVSGDLAETLLLADRVIYRDKTVRDEPGVMTKLAGGYSMLWMGLCAPRPPAGAAE